MNSKLQLCSIQCLSQFQVRFYTSLDTVFNVFESIAKAVLNNNLIIKYSTL